jgi:ribonuclease G
LPIFDVYNLTKQIKSSFGRIVPFRKGAYLVIEHTEALHVIDVNSGTRNKSSNVQEENAFEVNMAAVDEIAHQMRLRDMGGIVIIDLIDMRTAEHKQQVYERMCANMKNDSAKHQVLPLTKFGLMQITRQRVRPVTEVETQEVCPTCGGHTKIRSSILFVDWLATKIEMVEKQLKTKRFVLYVHPFVYAYLRQGFWSVLRKWRWKYGFRFRVLPNYDFALLQYKFVDASGNELDVHDNMGMA